MAWQAGAGYFAHGAAQPGPAGPALFPQRTHCCRSGRRLCRRVRGYPGRCAAAASTGGVRRLLVRRPAAAKLPPASAPSWDGTSRNPRRSWKPSKSSAPAFCASRRAWVRSLRPPPTSEATGQLSSCQQRARRGGQTRGLLFRDAGSAADWFSPIAMYPPASSVSSEMIPSTPQRPGAAWPPGHSPSRRKFCRPAR